MKHYTTIEQSKKLLELGLSPKSADMRWVALNWQETEYYVEVINEGFDVPKSYVPCWSLGALLEMMHNGTSIFYNYSYTIIDMVDVSGGIVSNKHREKGSTPIEAAYSMVIWLLENNYLKTEK